MARRAISQRSITRLEEFRHLAEQYIRIIGHHDRYPIRRLLQELHQLVPALYAAGVRLPSPLSKRQVKPDRVSLEEWRRLVLSLRRRLGNRDWYREVFDAYDRSDRGVVIGSLADDFADIYGDLQYGLSCWRQGDRDEAAWQWRFGADYHWGEHATSAMRALYWLHGGHDFGSPGAMPNSALQRTRSRVTARAKKHGPRHGARR